MPGTPPATARLAIPRYSDGDTASFSAQVNAISDTTDSKVGMYTAGTHAARLAATNIDGLLWRETDTAGLYLGTGTSWLPIGLVLRLVTANYTASAGELVQAGGTLAVTLPAPAVDAVVGVMQTGGGSATVSTPSGAIGGVGIGGGVTSFKLGTQQSSAILESDGTNWYIISGQQDTGWVPLTLQTGFGAGAVGYTPSARLVGDMVRLSGVIKNNTGSTQTGATWATVPTSMVPANTVQPMATVNDNAVNAAPVSVVAGSTSLIVQSAIGNTHSVFLDGASYRIS